MPDKRGRITVQDLLLAGLPAACGAAGKPIAGNKADYPRSPSESITVADGFKIGTGVILNIFASLKTIDLADFKKTVDAYSNAHPCALPPIAATALVVEFRKLVRALSQKAA